MPSAVDGATGFAGIREGGRKKEQILSTHVVTYEHCSRFHRSYDPFKLLLTQHRWFNLEVCESIASGLQKCTHNWLVCRNIWAASTDRYNNHDHGLLALATAAQNSFTCGVVSNHLSTGHRSLALTSCIAIMRTVFSLNLRPQCTNRSSSEGPNNSMTIAL